MRSLINAKISGFRLWIIPEPLIPRQEDRRLGERGNAELKTSGPASEKRLGTKGRRESRQRKFRKHFSKISQIFFKNVLLLLM